MKKIVLFWIVLTWLGNTIPLRSQSNKLTAEEEKTLKELSDVLNQKFDIAVNSIKTAKKKYQNNPKTYYEIMGLEADLYKTHEKFDMGLLVTDSLIQQNISKSLKAKGYVEKSIIFSKKGDFETSIQLLKKAIPIYEAENNKKGISTTFKMMGNIFFNISQQRDAVAYFKKAIEVYPDIKNTPAEASLYNNISRAYRAMNMKDSAIYYQNALKEIAFNQTEDQEIIFMAHLNEADYAAMDNDFQRAEKNINEAIKAADNLGNVSMKAAGLQVRSQLYKSQKKYNQAIEDVKSSMEIFKSLDSQIYYRSSQYLLIELYKLAGKYKEALEEFQSFEKENNAQREQAIQDNLKELKIKYETAEKDLKLSEQSLALKTKESERNLFLGSSVALTLLALLILSVLFQQKKVAKQKMAQLKTEQEIASLKSLMTGEEKERSRIARELHDGLGGILAAARMQLSNLSSEIDHQKIPAVEDLLLKASTESRRISHNLLPENLVKLGLDDALKDFIHGINEGKIIEVEYHSIGLEERLPENVELSVYRIIQELINNIIKHSGATEALVQLHKNNGILAITVEDNGRGFGNPSGKGIGLSNIESRLSLLEGKISIDTTEQKGTSVYIEITLNK